jgi:hypothetical protein
MVHDETLSGDRDNGLSLEFLNEVITVRELIRERVYEEVRQFNAAQPAVFHGLVRPDDALPVPHGFRMQSARKVDWEKQYQVALEAFDRNGFFILVDNKQVESLDETVLLRPTTEVSFVRLVPLVGG